MNISYIPNLRYSTVKTCKIANKFMFERVNWPLDNQNINDIDQIQYLKHFSEPGKSTLHAG